MKKKTVLVEGIIFFCVLIFATIGYSSNSTTMTTQHTTSPPQIQPGTTSPAPIYGGTFKLIYQTSAQNLGDPALIMSTQDFILARPCAEALIIADKKGNPSPSLAVSWEISPDMKSMILNIRKGVKFHDGKDLNAEAVKYNLDTSLKGLDPSLKRYVSSIDVVDAYTIRLNLLAYDAGLINALMLKCNIYSPAALQQYGKLANVNPVGTGPFKFVSLSRDSSIKYERFDGYWGGKPYLDALEVALIADETTALISFKSGVGDAWGNISPKIANELRSSGFKIHNTPGGVHCIISDAGNTNSIFSNIKVRQAVEYAIDKKTIVDAISYGFYQAANQLAVPGSIGYNPEVVGYPFNPEKAKQLLKEAGYSKGFKTKISFPVDPIYQTEFLMVQAYLRNVGIEVELDPAVQAKFQSLMFGQTDNQFVLFNINLPIGTDLGSALPTALSRKSRRFISALYPPEYEANLLAILSESDTQKRQILIEETQKMIIDQYAMIIPLSITTRNAAIGNAVHDCNLFTGNWNTWNPEKIWLTR